MKKALRFDLRLGDLSSTPCEFNGGTNVYPSLNNIVTFWESRATLRTMGNPAGLRRDFAGLERRRFYAAKLLGEGLPQAEVARQVGVHRQSVSRWDQQLQQGGLRALKKAGHAGRKPRLRPEDLRRIERGLRRGPEALGYENGLWTCRRVADLIQHECGVKYVPSQAWRILRQLGWSCQQPTGRALERNEEKIQQWKRVR